MRDHLKTKHELACGDKDFLQKGVQALALKIQRDTTGAFWHIKEYIDYMYKEAQRIDSLEKKGPFYGLSFGVKDLFTIKNMRTTAGSKMLRDFISPYTSTLVQDIQERGALVAGKLAMDEFAMGSYSNTSYLGRVSVPGRPDRSAGGSSGGSAAALDILDFTLGSDTGGSVRLPASFCGYVGYKPSYGTFSRFGMISYASSLDQAGLLTHSIEDLSYLMSQGIARKDPRDMTSSDKFEFTSGKTIKKIGYFPEILEGPLDEEVKTAYLKTLQMFSKEQLKPLRMEYLKYSTQIYYVIACAEAASNLARYQGVYFGSDIAETKGSYWEQVAHYRSAMFGSEVEKRIMLGSYITSSENFATIYKKATTLRQALKEEFDKVFTEVDTLLLPVSPFTAPTWQEISSMSSTQIYMADYMTVPFSLAGLCAISMPLHRDSKDLSIGMQFVGKSHEDGELISKCLDLEKKL